jgi:hypothetical protein
MGVIEVAKVKFLKSVMCYITLDSNNSVDARKERNISLSFIQVKNSEPNDMAFLFSWEGVGDMWPVFSTFRSCLLLPYLGQTLILNCHKSLTPWKYFLTFGL